MDSIFNQNQEVPMHTKVLIAILGLLAPIFAVNLSFPLSAKSVDTCFIKACTSDVYVIVYDVDRRGNKGYELWKGWIDKLSTAADRRLSNFEHLRCS